jgi:hypothetical protein
MIKIENYETKSSIPVKVFVVSLASGDKKRCKAENVGFEDGALNGIVYDPDHTDREGMMGQDVIWAFAPGTWVYVEREFPVPEHG